MKQKFIQWSRPILCACMAFSWWISCDLPCIALFGEIEYPSDDNSF